MRKDVKAGLALAFTVVVLAGWYHISKEPADESIALDTSDGVIVQLDADSRSRKKSPVAMQTRGVSSDRSSSRDGRGSGARSDRSARRKGNPSIARGASPSNKDPRTTDTNETSSRRGNDGPANVASSKRADARVASKSTPQNVRKSRGTQPGTQRRIRRSARNAPDGRSDPSTGRESASRAVSAKGRGYEAHIVKAGDTLSMIAEMYYGDSSQVALLRSANPQITDKDTLRIGQRVFLPPASHARSSDAAGNRARLTSQASSAPGRSDGRVGRAYEVKPGDSLYTVAQQKLGAGSRWKEIFKLNRDTIGSDPSRLKVGQKLRLPPS